MLLKKKKKQGMRRQERRHKQLPDDLRKTENPGIFKRKH
jgi:hypothetical protein